MEKITVNTNDKCEIIIGENIWLSELKAKLSGRKCFVLTDDNVAALLKNTLNENFGDNVYIINGGEKNKNFFTLNQIFDAMITAGLNRGGVLAALGGGVVGDMGGLAAGLYMRGTGLINIPTTLLAMADSSVGGKTAIDYGGYKNLIGMFYQPECVICDTAFLSSLSDREILSGVGEIVKTAALDEKLFDKIYENKNNLKDRNFIASIIPETVTVKKTIVEKDEKEKNGLRKYLNIGHTVGHMLEMRYMKKSHGEYVLEGLYYEMNIAKKAGITDKIFYEKFSDIIFSLIEMPNYDLNEELFRTALMDKKNSEGKISVMAIENAGKIKELRLTLKEFEQGMQK